MDYNLQLDGCTVTSSTVKNLGVILDSNLSFENHISHVTKTAVFHLRNIAKLRNMLTVSDAEKLVHALMTFRLDYCNALLGGCPASSINKLQIVQNAAARVITRSRKYDHITPILQSLHWLPIKFRISYKILLLPYKALNDIAPAYLTYLLSRYNPTRFLRSHNSGLLVVPRIAKSTKGDITFSYLAPKLWNSPPDNVRGSDTLSLFKSRLKTHLFSQAFIKMNLTILFCQSIWIYAHYYALACVILIISSRVIPGWNNCYVYYLYYFSVSATGLTSLNIGSGSGSKFNCAARVGSGQTISGTGRVRASVLSLCRPLVHSRGNSSV